MIGSNLSFQNSASVENSTVTELFFGSAMPRHLRLRCEAKDLSGNPKSTDQNVVFSRARSIWCRVRSSVAKMRILYLTVRE
jgi:hypothetical protein